MLMVIFQNLDTKHEWEICYPRLISNCWEGCTFHQRDSFYFWLREYHNRDFCKQVYLDTRNCWCFVQMSRHCVSWVSAHVLTTCLRRQWRWTAKTTSSAQFWLAGVRFRAAVNVYETTRQRFFVNRVYILDMKHKVRWSTWRDMSRGSISTGIEANHSACDYDSLGP